MKTSPHLPVFLLFFVLSWVPPTAPRPDGGPPPPRRGGASVLRNGCNGVNEGCCTEEFPCGLGDGDCDGDEECRGDLVCGTDNCPTVGLGQVASGLINVSRKKSLFSFRKGVFGIGRLLHVAPDAPQQKGGAEGEEGIG